MERQAGPFCCLWGRQWVRGFHRNWSEGTFHNAPDPHHPQVQLWLLLSPNSLPLHPGGYRWLVFTGEGGGGSSNFLFRDEILISSALSTLKVMALQTPELLLGCS